MLECSQNGQCHVSAGVPCPKFDACEDLAAGCFCDIQGKIRLEGSGYPYVFMPRRPDRLTTESLQGFDSSFPCSWYWIAVLQM